jgi:hypothetical protein
MYRRISTAATAGRSRVRAIAVAGAVVTAAGLASVSVANASTAAKPQTLTYTVQVPSSSPSLVDTGINISAGANVSIKASGKVIYRGDRPATGPKGFAVPGQKCASGLPTGPYFNDSLPCLSLIGAMGSSATFEVGPSLSIPTAEGGELYLMFNDNEWDDNSGSFTVTVTVS